MTDDLVSECVKVPVASHTTRVYHVVSVVSHVNDSVNSAGSRVSLQVVHVVVPVERGVVAVRAWAMQL